jgi:hypothetical protein
MDAQGWRDIYGSTPAAKYGMKRSDDFFAYFFDKQSTEASIVSANEENHRRFRKIFSRAFSKTALVAQEPLIVNHVDLLIRSLNDKESSNEMVDMVDMHCFTVFDIMADLMFGESLHLLDDTNSPNANFEVCTGIYCSKYCSRGSFKISFVQIVNGYLCASSYGEALQKILKVNK